APPAPDEGAGAEVVDFQAEAAKRKGRDNVEPPAADASDSGADPLAAMLADAQPENDPFAGAAPLTGSENDPFAAVPNSQSMEGPPRESTRMFIAAAGLANRGTKHKAYAAVGGLAVVALGTVLYLDAAGIVEIPIAHDVVNFGLAAVDVERPVKQRVVDGDDEGGFNISGLFGQKKEKPVAKRKHAAGTPGAEGDHGESLADALAGAKAGDGTVLGERKEDGTQAVELKSDLGTSEALKAKLSVDGKRGVEIRPGAGVTPQPKPTNTPTAADIPLTAEQIGKVVADQKASLTSCANDAAKAGEKYKGSVKVTVTIGPSGKVKKVVVNEPGVANMTLGQCLGRALMRWIFPAFSGEAFDAELTLKMSVGP
ncbi:MAG: AgmX/PglI C-terminal domain-containing protein, partial [Myxococcota bacterium]